jgi:chaperonin GroES
MKIKPLNDYVLVIRDQEERVTEGGIYIPESNTEKPVIGTVVAMHDRRDAPIGVGSKVLFDKYSGDEVKLEGKEYLLIRYEDIKARIE